MGRTCAHVTWGPGIHTHYHYIPVGAPQSPIIAWDTGKAECGLNSWPLLNNLLRINWTTNLPHLYELKKNQSNVDLANQLIVLKPSIIENIHKFYWWEIWNWRPTTINWWLQIHSLIQYFIYIEKSSWHKSRFNLDACNGYLFLNILLWEEEYNIARCYSKSRI